MDIQQKNKVKKKSVGLLYVEEENGMASLYVDGQHIVTADGLKMRSSPEQVVDSMVFHTFFGGSGSEWAAAKDEVLDSLVSAATLCVSTAYGP